MNKIGRVIAIKNQKGGVGKTTTAAHLSIGLAARGFDVFMVDMDGQGHLARAIGMEPDDGLYRVMLGDKSLAECVADVPHKRTAFSEAPGRLRILRGDAKTPVIALHMQLQSWDLAAVGEALREEVEAADFTIIDTPPTVTLMEQPILKMTDYIIIPTLLESWSIDGVGKVFATLTNLAGVHHAQVMGVLPMKVRRTNEHKMQLAGLQDSLPRVTWAEEGVPLRTVVAEAADVGESVWEYVPEEDAADHWTAVVDRFLEEMYGS